MPIIKKSNKKSNKKSKKGGSDELDIILDNLSLGYGHINLYKKLFRQDMVKKHSPTMLFNDIKKQLPYQSKMSNTNMGLHIGQRKLLLTEVQFLTNYSDIKYCIYVGSAPGNKTHFLSQLFPDIKFILIDPNKFDLVLADIPNNSKITHRHQPNKDIIHIYYEYPTKSDIYLNNKKMNDLNTTEEGKLTDFIKNSTHKIFIIEDYMNMKISNMLKTLGNTSFISDVRSSIEGVPNDFDIIWNTSMVYNWINVLQPEITMVKFRIPYYNEISDFNKYKDMYKDDFDISKKYGTDFINDYKTRKFKMSKCTLYIQPWKGYQSAEMRGYITKKDINNVIEYSIKDIENKLFYYNKILRMCYHTNINADKELHFCNCNDCAIENVIWDNYIKTFNTDNPVSHYINITNVITNRTLRNVHDINVYDIIDANKLEQMTKKTNKSTFYQNKTSQRGNKGNVY